MAISRRTDDLDGHTTSTTAISVSMPITPPQSDLLVAIITGLTVVSPAAVPSGWTLLGSQIGGANLGSWVYWKVATSSESGTYGWTLGSSVKSAGWIGCYAGTTGAAPTLLASNPAAGNAFVMPAVTVPANGWAITSVCARHSGIASASRWSTSDSGDSERVDFGSGSGGSDIAFAVYDSSRALTAGALARTLTSTNTETQVAAVSIAVPASASPGGGSATGARWGVHL
jgi:hypothetical protein